MAALESVGSTCNEGSRKGEDQQAHVSFELHANLAEAYVIDKNVDHFINSNGCL